MIGTVTVGQNSRIEFNIQELDSFINNNAFNRTDISEEKLTDVEDMEEKAKLSTHQSSAEKKSAPIPARKPYVGNEMKKEGVDTENNLVSYIININVSSLEALKKIREYLKND